MIGLIFFSAIRARSTRGGRIRFGPDKEDDECGTMEIKMKEENKSFVVYYPEQVSHGYDRIAVPDVALLQYITSMSYL